VCENCSKLESEGNLIIVEDEVRDGEFHLLIGLVVAVVTSTLAFGLAAFLHQGPALAGALMVALGGAIHACLNVYPPMNSARDTANSWNNGPGRWAFAGWMCITSGGILSASSFVNIDNTAKTTVSTGGTENLLSGLWGALISSAVAFVVIIVTVVAQRRATARQINAQRIATNEQITAQTLEQAKNRRVQAASEVLEGFFELNESADTDQSAAKRAHSRILKSLMQWRLDAGNAAPLIDELMEWADAMRSGALRYSVLRLNHPSGVPADSIEGQVRLRITECIGFLIGQIGEHFDARDVADHMRHLQSERSKLEPGIFGP
jgi:hypothetical protein